MELVVAALLPTQGVVSGMRSTCQIAVYVDVAKAMALGLKWYRSANGVLLTPGDCNGMVPPSCFEKVVILASGELMPMAPNAAAAGPPLTPQEAQDVKAQPAAAAVDGSIAGVTSTSAGAEAPAAAAPAAAAEAPAAAAPAAPAAPVAPAEASAAAAEPSGWEADAEVAKGSIFGAVGGGRLAVAGNPGKKGLRTWQAAGATAVVTLQKDNEGGGKKFRPAGIGQMCEDAGLKWLHLPLSGKHCLVAAVESEELGEGAGTDSADTRSLSKVVQVVSMLGAGESVVLHCDTGVQRSGAMAYLTMRHCELSPDEAVALVGRMRAITKVDLLKGPSGPGSSLQAQVEARLREERWMQNDASDEADGGDTGPPSASASKKRVSFAPDELLETSMFIPPSPRALILQTLAMAGGVEDEGDMGDKRKFFRVSLLRLMAWADGESDAIRGEYMDRFGNSVHYSKEYAGAWGVLAGHPAYRSSAVDLFVALTEGSGLLRVNAITVPYLLTNMELATAGGAGGVEGEAVLTDALAALRDGTGLTATPLRISYYLAAFWSRFHQNQVHFG